jgi:hypothetical protein
MSRDGLVEHLVIFVEMGLGQEDHHIALVGEVGPGSLVRLDVVSVGIIGMGGSFFVVRRVVFHGRLEWKGLMC